MKNNLKLYMALLLVVIITGACSKSDGGDDSPPLPPPNSVPSAVSQLVFPTSDLLCIDNTVRFEWGASSDADGDSISYILVVATDRLLTQVVEQRTVSSTSITISLDRGVAYYWNVTAKDSQGGEANPSSTFAFYTEGDGVSNYAPFSAGLNAPENDGLVEAGTVNLSWTGGDTDTGDILTYELFFGETMDPTLLQSILSEENFDVTVSTGLTYYWKVNTMDDSGLKTIGQVWQFTAN